MQNRYLSGGHTSSVVAGDDDGKFHAVCRWFGGSPAKINPETRDREWLQAGFRRCVTVSEPVLTQWAVIPHLPGFDTIGSEIFVKGVRAARCGTAGGRAQ